jgi:hypothetical protein
MIIRVHVDNDPDLVDDLVVILERIALNVTTNVLVEVDDEG